MARLDSTQDIDNPLPGESFDDFDQRRQAGIASQAASDQADQQAQYQRDQAATKSAYQSQGIANFTASSGALRALIDPPTGAFMTGDGSNGGIAYTPSGTPKRVVYAGLDRPTLVDPMTPEGGATTKTVGGNDYTVSDGLPWQWNGVNADAAAAAHQKDQDSTLASASTIYGQQVSQAKAQLAGTNAALKTNTKALQGVPELSGVDVDGDNVSDSVDKAFAPVGDAYNEKTGWFGGGDLTPAARAARDDLAQRKQQAQALLTQRQQTQQQATALQQQHDAAQSRLDTVTTRRAQLATQKLGAVGVSVPDDSGSTLSPMPQPSVAGMAAPDDDDEDSSAVPAATAGASVGATGSAAIPALTPAAPNKPTPIQPFSPSEPPFKVDDAGNFSIDPTRLSEGLIAANKAGIIPDDKLKTLLPQAVDAEKAAQAQQSAVNDLQAKQASAGSYAPAKAAAYGAAKAGGFLASSAPGAAIGAEIGAFGGPLDPITVPTGAIIGGLITGTLGSFAVDKTARALSNYSDTIKSFTDSSDLHPYYDAAGNLLAFGAGLPKVATTALSEGAGALAGEGTGVFSRVARGAADNYANSGGVADTIQNLAQDASIRAGGGASATQIATALASRVGGQAAANAGIDTLLKTGAQAFGFSNQGQTIPGAVQAALIGAFTAGHGIKFEDFSNSDVADIAARGEARKNAGLAPDEALSAADIAAKYPNADVLQTQALSKPLSAKEQEVYNAADAAVRASMARGEKAVPGQTEITAKQATVGGQPYGVTSAEIRNPGDPSPLTPSNAGATPPALPALQNIAPSQTLPETEAPSQISADAASPGSPTQSVPPNPVAQSSPGSTVTPPAGQVQPVAEHEDDDHIPGLAAPQMDPSTAQAVAARLNAGAPSEIEGHIPTIAYGALTRLKASGVPITPEYVQQIAGQVSAIMSSSESNKQARIAELVTSGQPVDQSQEDGTVPSGLGPSGAAGSPQAGQPTPTPSQIPGLPPSQAPTVVPPDAAQAPSSLPAARSTPSANPIAAAPTPQVDSGVTALIQSRDGYQALLDQGKVRPEAVEATQGMVNHLSRQIESAAPGTDVARTPVAKPTEAAAAAPTPLPTPLPPLKRGDKISYNGMPGSVLRTSPGSSWVYAQLIPPQATGLPRKEVRLKIADIDRIAPNLSAQPTTTPANATTQKEALQPGAGGDVNAAASPATAATASAGGGAGGRPGTGPDGRIAPTSPSSADAPARTQEEGASPVAKPVNAHQAMAMAEKHIHSNRRVLKGLGVTNSRFMPTTAPSGVELASDGTLRVNPAKLARSMTTVRDNQRKLGLDGTLEDWVNQVFAHEGIHAADAAIARSKGQTLKQRYDALPLEAMPEGWNAAGANIYGPEWTGLPEWKQKAEFVRMVVEKKWTGKITEALYKFIKDAVDYLKRAAGFKDADPRFKAHVEEIERRIDEARRSSNDGGKLAPEDQGALFTPEPIDSNAKLANNDELAAARPITDQDEAGFTSQLARTISALPQETMTVAQARATIEKGSKPAEREFTGILTDPLSPLTDKPLGAKVTKTELRDYAIERQAKTQEVTLSDGADLSDAHIESVARDQFDEEWENGDWDDWAHEGRKDLKEKVFDEVEEKYEERARRKSLEEYPDDEDADYYAPRELFDEDWDSGEFENHPTVKNEEDGMQEQAWKNNKSDIMRMARRKEEELHEGDPNATHFSGYTLPGSDKGSYRESFITWPHVDTYDPSSANWSDGHSEYSSITNPIVRLRYNTRTDADSKKTLFLEEIQGPSKDNQERMPEFLRKRIYEIGMKRALRIAADEGADRLGWTTGAQQANRYDLSKRVSRLEYQSDGGILRDGESAGARVLTAHDLHGREVFRKNVTPDNLPSIIGKDASAKLLDQNETLGPWTGSTRSRSRVLEGENLKVGGSGLSALYDQTLPRIANELGKKFGVKTGQQSIQLGTHAEYEPGMSPEAAAALGSTKTVHSIDIPDEFRQHVQRGQSLFAAKPGDELEPTTWSKVGELLHNIREVAVGPDSALHSAVDDVRKVFSPASRGPDAKSTAEALQQVTAEMDRRSQIQHAAISGFQKMIAALPEDRQKELLFALDDKTPLGDPELEKALSEFRKLDDARMQEFRAELPKYGITHWENWANFQRTEIPHIFKQPETARRAIEKRFESNKNFLKRRGNMTWRELIQDMGLEPESYNAVDLVAARWTAQERFLGAQKLADMMVEAKSGHFERTDYEPKEGEKEIGHRLLTRTVEIDGQPRKLKFFAQEPAALIVEHYLSQGLRGKAWYRAYAATAKRLNAAQLGLSAFHGGFITMESVTNQVGLAIDHLAHGELGKALAAIARAPISPILDYKSGKRLVGELRKPGSESEAIANLVNQIISGGGRASLDSIYHENDTQKFLNAFRQKKFIPAALRAPMAAMEQISAPITQKYVPYLKMAAAAKLISAALERNPNMSATELRSVASDKVTSVNNTFGQMTYDNLHMHKTVKDILMGMTRSLGWNWGTFAELGGGVKDFFVNGFRAANKAAGRPGPSPEFTAKMAYTLALPLVAGTLGAILNGLFGQKPESLKDYYFPKTGDHDSHGQPLRLSLPTYMKDVFAFADSPTSTFTNKLHPLLSAIGNMFQNRDFYGTKIRNEDDPILQQVLDEAKYAGKQFIPFTFSNAAQTSKDGASLPVKALGFVGFGKAPARINQTDAEKLAQKFELERAPAGSRTREQAELSQAKNKIINSLRQHDMGPLHAALASGQILGREVPELQRRASMTWLESMVHSLGLPEAQKVLAVATPKERQAILPLIAAKEASSRRRLALSTSQSPAVASALARLKLVPQ